MADELHPGEPGYDTRQRPVLILASYCAGDPPDCTDAAPCLECLKMCNVATMAGPVVAIRGGWDYVRKGGDARRDNGENIDV